MMIWFSLFSLVIVTITTTTTALAGTVATPTTTTTTTTTSIRQDLRQEIQNILVNRKDWHILLDLGMENKQEIQQAKTQLAQHIVHFLREREQEPVYSGLSESSSLCAKLLNTWMATCVFG